MKAGLAALTLAGCLVCTLHGNSPRERQSPVGRCLAEAHFAVRVLYSPSDVYVPIYPLVFRPVEPTDILVGQTLFVKDVGYVVFAPRKELEASFRRVLRLLPNAETTEKPLNLRLKMPLFRHPDQPALEVALTCSSGTIVLRFPEKETCQALQSFAAELNNRGAFCELGKFSASFRCNLQGYDQKACESGE